MVGAPFFFVTDGGIGGGTCILLTRARYPEEGVGAASIRDTLCEI